MAAVAGAVGLIALGFVIGAVFQGYADRRLLSIARTAFWHAKQTSISAQTYMGTAKRLHASSERLKLLSDEQKARADRAWAEVQVHEARAEAHFDRAKALYQEMS